MFHGVINLSHYRRFIIKLTFKIYFFVTLFIINSTNYFLRIKFFLFLC